MLLPADDIQQTPESDCISRLAPAPVKVSRGSKYRRANALQEDRRNESQSGLPGFFTLCKDADPDIPILKEAKAEYMKLQ
jgi:hypothetical protein